MVSEDKKEWLTLTEAAQLLGYSPRRVMDMQRDGMFPNTIRGEDSATARFLRSDLLHPGKASMAVATPQQSGAGKEAPAVSPGDEILAAVNRLPEVIAQRRDEEIQASKTRMAEQAVKMKLAENNLATIDNAIRLAVETSNMARTLELAKVDLVKREGEHDKKVADFQPVINGLAQREAVVSESEKGLAERKEAIEAEISDREGRLTELSTQISAEQDRLINGIKKWYGILDTATTRSYHLADKSTGKTAEYHIRKGNEALDFMDELKKLWEKIKKLGG